MDSYYVEINVIFNFFHRNPLAQMEEEKREHAMKLKKMEAEMEQVFESKVKEKKQKLKESEADVSLCTYFSVSKAPSSAFYFLLPAPNFSFTSLRSFE